MHKENGAKATYPYFCITLARCLELIPDLVVEISNHGSFLLNQPHSVYLAGT